MKVRLVLLIDNTPRTIHLGTVTEIHYNFPTFPTLPTRSNQIAFEMKGKGVVYRIEDVLEFEVVQ